ncbi:MAG: nucleotidyltransferase domain-containing protein [Bacteroidetes bacterium]|nr:nucleotidyltransferase domain-containing protein [Bacteroidota bacterium]
MENLNNKENKIEIKPMGSYFEIDQDGYIKNPTSIEKIQGEWKELVDDIVEIYRKAYGEHLKQVYIRGSVAKGEAVKGVSDIDTFAYVDLPEDYLKEHNTNREMRKEITEKYAFVDDIEMEACPLSEIKDDYILLNQSVCVYGEPLEIPKMKPGKEMAIHSPNFRNRLVWFEKFLAKENEPEEEIKKGCVWLMKGLLRVGFEITMERSGRYTRDLYKCYETFSEYYPEKESEMREVLYYALNPTTDKSKIKSIVDGIGEFLLSEIPKYFEISS